MKNVFFAAFYIVILGPLINLYIESFGYEAQRLSLKLIVQVFAMK